MEASELYVKCLGEEKVKVIFGLPGKENVHVKDALRGSSMRFTLTRQGRAN